MTPLDFDRFEVLTFDCYGTLIDWETGIVAALRSAASWQASDEELLERFAAHEAEAEPDAVYPSLAAFADAAVGGTMPRQEGS